MRIKWQEIVTQSHVVILDLDGVIIKSNFIKYRSR